MTTTDATLFDYAELVTPDYAPDLTIQQRFDAWIEANQWVLTTVEREISEWLAAGHTRASLKQVWEVIRYQYGKTTGDTFKANNSWTSRMARLVLERHPEWKPFIETRELRAA